MSRNGQSNALVASLTKLVLGCKDQDVLNVIVRDIFQERARAVNEVVEDQVKLILEHDGIESGSAIIRRMVENVQ